MKLTDYLKKTSKQNHILYECTSSENHAIIKERPSDKASDISISVLKRAAASISGHLSGFIKKLIDLGIVPKIRYWVKLPQKRRRTISNLTTTVPFP